MIAACVAVAGCTSALTTTTATTTTVTTTTEVATTTTAALITTTAAPTTTTTEPLRLTIGEWEPIPAAPVARAYYESVWTGREMLVLGNGFGPDVTKATGAAYDPATRAWTAITPIPDARMNAASVWTGSQWLIWGGARTDMTSPDDGFAYDPSSDSWSTIPPAPIEGRLGAFTVWTGTELIVWGGSVVEPEEGSFNDGAAYNPTSKTWRVLADAPLGQKNAGVAVWTGDEMIVGGNGDATDGDPGWASYDPTTDSWTPIASPDDMDAGMVYFGAWTGTHIVFAPFEQETTRLWLYEPATDQWTRSAPIDAGGLSLAPMVWTGSDIVLYGTDPFPPMWVQVAYDPATDTWYDLPDGDHQRVGAIPTVIWDQNVIVWGGAHGASSNDYYDDGEVLILP